MGAAVYAQALRGTPSLRYTLTMRIELLGPSGVGKSTALQAARGLRAREPEWIGPPEADDILEGSLRERDRETIRSAIDDPELRAFIDHCITVVAASSMMPSQKVSALRMLQKSCLESRLLLSIPDHTVLVHDELLLHRAYSLLLYSDQVEVDAARYFELVPLPEAVVIFCADEDTILSRVRGRQSLPNIYTGLDDAGLRTVISAGIEVATIAKDVLQNRGIGVRTIEVTSGAERSAQALHTFCLNLSVKERV